MRIDAHQHFWNYQPDRDHWITDEMSILRRDYLPVSLYPLLVENSIDGCVAVQADQSLEETRFLLSLAEKHDWIKGVVGWVDLESNTLPDQLEEFSNELKLVGFRHILQAEPNGKMTNPRFVEGVNLLGQYDFTYDLLIYHDQLDEAIGFVSGITTPVVLDHFGKPDIQSGQLASWKSGLNELAQRENVTIKLSGLVTEADWENWSVEALQPYFDAVLEAFGTDRIMFGSDWPVCLLASTYTQWIETVEVLISGLSSKEKDMITGENAIRFYNLNKGVHGPQA
ncbi:MAG: amidohydrolase family protein [Bacteroidota bacterium]